MIPFLRTVRDGVISLRQRKWWIACSNYCRNSWNKNENLEGTLKFCWRSAIVIWFKIRSSLITSIFQWKRKPRTGLHISPVEKSRCAFSFQPNVKVAKSSQSPIVLWIRKDSNEHHITPHSSFAYTRQTMIFCFDSSFVEIGREGTCRRFLLVLHANPHLHTRPSINT